MTRDVHDRHDPSRRRGIAFGIAAAVTFGASAPIAKVLLPEWSPLALTAALYLGAGVFLTFVRAVRHLTTRDSGESPLRLADLPSLALIALLGGFLGPLLMLTGLERTSAFTASVLLNLEAPLTAGLAVLFFREHLTRREALAACLIFAGATLLAVAPGGSSGDLLGPLLIAGACFCWAIDNNLTQRLSGRDPVALTQAKTLAAATLAAVLTLHTRAAVPAELTSLWAALGLGAVSYGLSVLLDAYALRAIGAAREAAIFASAPFAGAALAVLLLDERPSRLDGMGTALMIVGVVLVARARHAHTHRHEPVEHEHRHVHDAHHQHTHGEQPVTEPHSHTHRHEPLEHAHPHVSDAHHRHRH